MSTNLTLKKRSPREFGRYIFFSFALIFILLFAFKIPRVSIPLIVSYAVVLILNPIWPFLYKLKISRPTGSLAIIIGLFFFIISPIIKFAPVITEESRNLQYYIPKVEAYAKKKYSQLANQTYEKTGYRLDPSYLDQGIEIGKRSLGKFLLGLPKFLASTLEWIFLVPLFVFFLLRDNKAIESNLLKICPNSIFERYYSLTHQFGKQLGGYIFAKFVEAAIVGTIITAGLLILGVRFSVILGFIAGVTNIIPYMGPIIGFIPAVVVGLIEYQGTSTFWAIITLYMVANAIDIGIVFPILVSRMVNLHPVVVVISVILGSQYFGIIGMVISIPAAAVVKLVIHEVYNEIYGNRAA